MTTAEPPRVRALSIHADYRCRDSGACCSSGWAIPVEPRIEERIRSGLRAGADGLRPVAGLPHGARVVLRTDARGRCAFLEGNPAHHRCAVHRQIGEEALPSACRHFPRVVTLSPLGVSVTLSHYCPTAAGMLFVIPRSFVSPGDEESAGPAMTHDPGLRIVEDPPAFPAGWPWEGLDARDALPPLLRPGVLMDWPSLERWERFAVSVLAEESRSPEVALEILATAAEDARRWTPADGPFGPFFDSVLALSPRGPAPALSPRGTPVPRGLPGLRTSRRPARTQRLGVTWPDKARQLVADCVPHGALLPPAPDGLDEADEQWVAPAWSALSLPIRHWLATKAFASWIALQGEGLRTTVAFLRVALAVLRAEAARACADAGRVLDSDLLKEAFRQTDLLLVHLADPEALARQLSRCEVHPAPLDASMLVI